MSQVEPISAQAPGENTKSPERKSGAALVPYKSNVPALLPPSLGDIDAYIRAANAAPVLSAQEEHSLAVQLRDKTT